MNTLHTNQEISKLDELKKALRLDEAVRLKSPVSVKVRKFNMRTGCADTVVDMKVEFVGKVPYGSPKAEDDLANHVMIAYGEKTYSSGNAYLGSEKLTYTDDWELQKVIDAVKEGTARPSNDYFEALRVYVN